MCPMLVMLPMDMDMESKHAILLEGQNGSKKTSALLLKFLLLENINKK